MTGADENGEQAALWNGAAGKGWVAAGSLLDRMYAPFADLLAEEAAALGARQVLDVGCGAGATSLMLAARLGEGDVLGVDISLPLIEAAKARAARENGRARFLCADAAAHEFPRRAFDLLVSRFGVSFFADPVRAFANLRRAACPGAVLRFLTWRAPQENPFLTVAEQAAAPELSLTPQAPAAPGPFALADRRRAADLLMQGGWRGVEIKAVDRACAFPAEGLTHYLRWMGPVGRVLQCADEDRRARILEKVRPAFDSYVQGDDVRFDAACWMLEAEAGPD
jgi:SAM-dependent methyltransferase